jgi:hypothetical protein
MSISLPDIFRRANGCLLRCRKLSAIGRHTVRLPLIDTGATKLRVFDNDQE